LTLTFRGPGSLDMGQVLAAAVPEAAIGVAPSEPELRQPIDDRPADVDPVREVVMTRSRFIER
jgi:hypothetical protein